MSYVKSKRKKTVVEESANVDTSLGDLHECALALHIAGQAEWATKLANAHEQLSALYLLASDLYERLDHHRIPVGYQMQQDVDRLLLGGN